ncbi:uncharacterized protein [Penaeus vannamei]|uniref:uncharacterized protein n=1 Tax=Penaeus vannamei TaxID=6689 RepID=UPI00387F7E46
MKIAFGFMSLIAVYAPTDVCKLDMKKMFYAKLVSVSDRCPRCDIRIVLGDFNAVSGCDRAGYEMSVSPHGSGTDTGSENSLLSRDFAKSQKLRISGSWYQRPDPHYQKERNELIPALPGGSTNLLSSRSLRGVE